MSKVLLGLVAVAAVGGIAFAASKSASAASSGDAGGPVDLVTGDSGTTYQVQMVNSVATPNGQQLFFKVFDAAGLVLEYTQFQGDNAHRQLVATPDAPHQPGDPMWVQAMTDFGILNSA